MGCFSIFPCFTSFKQSKPNKSINPITSSFSPDQGCNKNRESVLIKIPTEESTNIQSVKIPICKSRDNSEGQVINDSDVEIENDNKKEKQSNYNSVVEVKTENEKKMEIVSKEEDQSFKVHLELENESDLEKDSSVSSYISYPPMHRYHNCVINEDEDQVVIQEESSESLFSLSIDPRSRLDSCLVEVNDNEVNSPLKTNSSPKLIAKSIRSFNNENDHNQTIDLMNPIENLVQWKTRRHQEKENMYLEQEDININIPVSEDPIFKVSDNKGKVKTNTAVTTSLSSWLVDPEKSKSTKVSKEESQHSTGNSNAYAYSDGATSWKSFEDRPILGAWTIDEVKQISARSSPRKSPCRNPDETPIIGTVGSYWSHGMQATDSSSSCTSPFGVSAKSRRRRESKALSCHSSPTKRRLDRAFNKTAV